MTGYLLARSIGVIAGLRALTAPAAASWAARLGILELSSTWLAFLGSAVTPWGFSALAAAELVTDQLPTTPSRTVPGQLGARIVLGGLSGAAFLAPSGQWLTGAALGIVGALLGTSGGAWVRAQLARAFGRDLPAALLEDAVAVGGAVAIVLAAR